MPLYLYDKNPFNDINYLLNKDVIFEDIPYMLAETFLDDYDEGASYNWAQYKTFRNAGGSVPLRPPGRNHPYENGGSVQGCHRCQCGSADKAGKCPSGDHLLFLLSALFPFGGTI